MPQAGERAGRELSAAWAVSKAPWEPRLRSALCRARVAAEPRFCDGRDPYACARYRRHDGYFQRGRSGVVRPLPYAEPERLVSISMRLPSVKLETLTSGISCHSSGKAT